MRRWLNPAAIVAAVGLVLSFAFAYTMAKEPGLYWTRVQARFMPPDLDASNAYRYTPASMVLTAAAVGKMMDNSDHARMADADALLIGQGVRQGFSVNLPNTGGQWANQFVSPYLDVQVVDSSAEAVTAKTRSLIAQIAADLVWLQDQGGASQNYRITIQTSPLAVSYSKGSSGRAGLVGLFVGLGVTYACVRIASYDRRPRGAHYVQHPSVAARMRNRSSSQPEPARVEDSEVSGRTRELSGTRG
jgi:hypothetical protein